MHHVSTVNLRPLHARSGPSIAITTRGRETKGFRRRSSRFGERAFCDGAVHSMPEYCKFVDHLNIDQISSVEI